MESQCCAPLQIIEVIIWSLMPVRPRKRRTKTWPNGSDCKLAIDITMRQWMNSAASRMFSSKEFNSTRSNRKRRKDSKNS